MNFQRRSRKLAETTVENGQEQRTDTTSRRPPRRRRFTRRPRTCQFCSDHTKSIDYKQVDLLKRFINEQKKIRPRRETGTCSKHQRMLAGAIKRARHMALIAFTAERWR
ncbi:MAG TPA: 30S ribosomal protein S18 [Anaerolineae bacterium]|nr:30S ribosomal protein S18 [Anaerolineae bacterium]